MDEQWRPLGKILEELWVFPGRVPKSSMKYGFFEEGAKILSELWVF